MKKRLFILITLLLLSIPAVQSLFITGGFTSHDLTHHVIRQIDMDRLLSEGQFPPRWSGELNHGYGYPTFLFNYPLPPLLGEVFHKLGFGFVDSVKAVLFSSMVISLVGMYLFLNELLGGELPAFLGAIFYLYAPIRFLTVYVAAALGEALGIAIVPWVFWMMLLIVKNNSQKLNLLLGSLFLALLILSHNVTAFLFVPVLAIFGCYLVWQSKKPIVMAKRLALMFFWGLFLSAWFWLPAIFEKGYIRFDQIYANFYRDQFVSLNQLLRSPWGYGLSHPQHPQNGDMSYQLGLAQILVMVLLAVLVVFYRRKEIRVIGGFALGLFAVSVLMMLQISLPIWEHLPILSLIQFPLRFQTIAIFCASIAAGLLVKYLPFKKLVFLGLLILVIFANRNHWRINERFDPGEKYYLSLKTTTSSYGEHLPKWGRVMDQPPVAKLEFLANAGQIKIVKNRSNLLLAEVSSSEAGRLRFNQFYFPGWMIKVDGKKTQLDYLNDPQSYGLIEFDVDKGGHLVQVSFEDTADRAFADSISMISVILWLILLCQVFISQKSFFTKSVS